MNLEKTIIHEAAIGPSRISVRLAISAEKDGFFVTFDAADQGKHHAVRHRHTFAVPDPGLLQNATNELAANYASRTCKAPRREQCLGVLQRWLLGIRAWMVLGDITTGTTIQMTFYRVETKYGEQILLAFGRRRYQLVPPAFAEEFRKFCTTACVNPESQIDT